MPHSAAVLELSSLPRWTLWAFAGLGLAGLFAVVWRLVPRTGRWWAAIVLAAVVAVVAVKGSGDDHPRAVLWGTGLFGLAVAVPLRWLGPMPAAGDPGGAPRSATWQRRARILGWLLGFLFVALAIASAVLVGGL